MPHSAISRRFFLMGTSFCPLALGQTLRTPTFPNLLFNNSPVLSVLGACIGFLRKGPVLSVEWTPPEADATVPLFSGTVEVSTMEAVLRQLLPFDDSLESQSRHDGAIIDVLSVDRDQRYRELLSLPVAPRYFSGKNWNSGIVDDYVRSCRELRIWIEEFHRAERKRAGVPDPEPASYGSGLGGTSPYPIPEYNIELSGKTLRDQLDQIALYTVGVAEKQRDGMVKNNPAGWIVAIAPPFRFDRFQESEIFVRGFPGGSVIGRYFSTRSQRIKRR